MSAQAEPLLPSVAAAEVLGGAIDGADAVEVLVALAADVRALIPALIADGLGAEAVTRIISLLNDRLVSRLIRQHASVMRLPPAEWCWLGLGSEGRMEQTLATDQDNGLVFAAADAREAAVLRERFLPFAQQVNADLARCGFPLCDGQVMAGNPRWCLSVDEWRDCFTSWVRTPEPEALLNASIFFDFRPIVGTAALALMMRNHLTGIARGNDIFLRMMATNALQAEPPLGRLKDFVTDPAAGNTLDLKKFGSRLFVDAARIFALADGVPSPATIPRLRGVATGGSLQTAEAASAAEAFVAIQGLRLTVQRSGTGDNRIDPERLGEFERRLLLDALRQARQLQRRLKIRFHIEG